MNRSFSGRSLLAQFAVILAAAGRSTRFGESSRKKPFVELHGRAIWLRALDPFLARDDVTQTIVVVSADEMDWFREKYQANLAFQNIDVVAGGKERADSVQNALDQVKPEVDFVAVHDAARPLITSAVVSSVFKAAIESQAALPANRIASTIKRVMNSNVTETVDRTDLWAAQTPQVFRKSLLIEAYESRDDFAATDECQLAERLGHTVRVVESPASNFKITTQDDLRMAEAIWSMISQSGSAKPLHPFSDEKPDFFT